MQLIIMRIHLVANCNAPLQLVGLASGNIFLSLITKFIPGTRFNESVSWDKYAITKSSNNHRMQVISTQTLIVKKILMLMNLEYQRVGNTLMPTTAIVLHGAVFLIHGDHMQVILLQ
jgi:hypothetical protein